jgi:hypothetical protein
MQRSLQVSLVATFGALHATLYFLSFGLWRNWGIYLAPVEAIVLGPSYGFTAALIGSLTARLIRPDPFWMFGIIAEPASVLFTGFLVKGRWKPVLLSYGAMLVLYFLNPEGIILPVWTIADVLIAALLIYPIAQLSNRFTTMKLKAFSSFLALVSFVCVATDSLLRIFMFIPCGLYNLYAIDSNTLYGIFVGAAVNSFVEDLIAVAVSVSVCVPLIMTLLKLDLIVDAKEKKGKH